MPQYKYVALDLNNKKVSGIKESRDEKDFRQMMRNEKLVPISFRELKEKTVSYRMKADEIAEFARQLAGMLGSGVTLLRSVEIMQERNMSAGLMQLYNKLYKEIQSGTTLSEAMRRQPGAFPPLMMNMCASGEVGGHLNRVMEKMADYYDKEHRLAGKVKTAMTYPTILAVVMVIVVLLIFTVVLPPLFEILAEVELPWITKVMLAVSSFSEAHRLYAIVGIGLLGCVIYYVKRIPKVVYRLDRLKLNLWIAGKLLKIIYTARFAGTLATLYSGGIPIVRALEISSTIIGNQFIMVQFDEVVKNIRNGETLSFAILKVEGFDPKLGHAIQVGEESGHLEEMLIAIADSFDHEAELSIGRLIQLIEPIMLIIMAIIIGTIILSVMLPVMTLYQSMGNL